MKKIPGVGNPTGTKATQLPGSEETKSADQEQGKTGKGQKVTKVLKKKLKSFISPKSKKTEGKKKPEQTSIATRDTKHSEPANSVKASEARASNDHGGAVIAECEGYVEGVPGAYGAIVYEALKHAEKLNPSSNLEPSAGVALMGNAPESSSMATSPLEEGDQLMQILKDSVAAGEVKGEIDSLVDASQERFDQAIELQESLVEQKKSVMEALAENKELLASAEESQAQLSQQVADGTSQINQLQGEVSDLQGSIADTNQAIVEQQDVVNELQNELAEAQSLLDSANAGVEDGYNDAANAAIERFTALVEENQSLLARQQAELASFERALEVKSTELAASERELADLQAQLAETDNTVVTLTEETTALQSQLDGLGQDLAQASGEVSEAGEQLTELNGIDDLANDAVEAGNLEAVQDLLSEAKVVAGAAEAVDVSEEVVSGTESSAIADSLEPLSAGIDVGAGLLANSITLGVKAYKLSKLKNRQEAFSKCGEVIERWGSDNSDNSDNEVEKSASVQDLKDYALVTKLSEGTAEKTDHLRAVLSESKCHLSDDRKIARLAGHLIEIAGEIDGDKGSNIPKDWRGEPIASQLTKWKTDFEQKGKEYIEAQKTGGTRSSDGKKLIKLGHQSKRLMQQFNAIVKPLGVEMKFNTPKLRKFGESALATGHQLVINDKKLHAHLSQADKLPSREDIKQLVLDHQDDAPALKAFANYEQRKIDHQKSQMKWTGAALLAAGIPVLKIDYGIRAGREFSEAKYRGQNNKILDSKLNNIALFLTNHFKLVEGNKSIKGALELAADVITAKKDRTQVKKRSALAQGTIDTAGATAGTAASIAAPGIGSLVTNAAVGGAKVGAALGAMRGRNNVDKKNQQFGRIETKVYTELKNAYNSSGSETEKGDISELTQKLFDISSDQAKMLFAQSSDKDLVSAKGMIRLRFTNTSVGKAADNSGKAAEVGQSDFINAEVQKNLANHGKDKRVDQDNSGYEIPSSSWLYRNKDDGDQDTHL